MAIGFREPFEFSLVVNVWIGKLEGAGSTSDVGGDIADAGNFGEIASDRGGTGTSVHVGHFETDKGGGRSPRGFSSDRFALRC